ncbi:hypothetical protein BH11BAC4_BH11BAC4_05740 [soil metagenome]
MKRFFIGFILITCLSLNSTSQKVMIKGKEGERLLAWNDFNGTADANARHAALTAWTVHYSYTGVDLESTRVSFKELEVTLQLDNDRSWVKEGKGTVYLLKHEQGHFDIGRLCQLEILANVKSTNFDKAGFRSQMKSIFKNAMEKYKSLGSKYDEETNHSINKEKQEEWNAFLLKEKERLLKLN